MMANEYPDLLLEKYPYFSSPFPTTYFFELTATCNHKCVGCGNVFIKENQYLPAQKWVQILEKIKPTIANVRITGGECTLHPEFSEIIHAIDKLAIPFVIFTNGNWKNPEKLVRLFLNCNHLSGLLISLQGHNKENYKKFVGIDAFDQVLSNISFASQAGIKVSTNTILLKSTNKYINEIHELAIHAGASYAAFSRYYGKSLPRFELNNRELLRALEEISKLRKNNISVRINNCVPMCFSTDLDIPIRGCTSGMTHGTVDPLGNLRPCTHAPLVLGNLFEQTIEEIWQSPRLTLWNNFIPKDCIGCSVFASCRGGCRAIAFHQGVKADPIIQEPITVKTEHEVKRLHLYRNLIPNPRYKVIQHVSGLHIVGRNGQMAVSEQALEYLNAINGVDTLDHIQKNKGKLAIDFIGTLVINGLVDLLDTPK